MEAVCNEAVPFLTRDKENDQAYQKKHPNERGTHSCLSSFFHTALLIISTTSLISNIILLTDLDHFFQRYRRASPPVEAPFSPADQARIYELRAVETHDLQTPFGGPPGHVFDVAWSKLLWPTSIEVTTEELRQANKKSLRLRNRDSYLGYLEVYHQLHCVKRMVQSRWPERYPDLVAQNKLSDTHFNHCIEVLRKGIMCNADTSLNTFVWDANNSTNMVGISDAPRKCVNWERLDGWARTRALGPHYQLLDANEPDHLGPTS